MERYYQGKNWRGNFFMDEQFSRLMERTPCFGKHIFSKMGSVLIFFGCV